MFTFMDADLHVYEQFICQCILYLHYERKDVKDRHLANQIEQERVATEDGGCVDVILKENINSLRKKKLKVPQTYSIVCLKHCSIMSIVLYVFTSTLERSHQRVMSTTGCTFPMISST